MQERTFEMILALFSIRIQEISQKHGMGQAYIKGHLEEARHQLKLYCKKNYKDLNHGF
jgi:hypothetical protein